MKKVLYIALGASLSIFLLLTAVQLVSFDINHYLTQYERNEIVSRVEMDESNLEFVTRQILSYLSNEIDDLRVEALWSNEIREVFSKREIEHMKDVKNLFIMGRWVRLFSAITLLLIIGLVFKYDSLWRKNISKAFIYTGTINFSLVVVFYACLRSDFTKYFDGFHHLFFDNDLWILDPNTEILVQILPETFFYNTAMKIALLFFVPLTLLGLSSSYYLFTRKGLE